MDSGVGVEEGDGMDTVDHSGGVVGVGSCVEVDSGADVGAGGSATRDGMVEDSPDALLDIDGRVAHSCDHLGRHGGGGLVVVGGSGGLGGLDAAARVGVQNTHRGVRIDAAAAAVRVDSHCAGDSHCVEVADCMGVLGPHPRRAGGGMP